MIAVGFVCRFCNTTVRTTVPETTTRAQAAGVLDDLLTLHCAAHVEDFLYGEGGVFGGKGPVQDTLPPGT